MSDVTNNAYVVQFNGEPSPHGSGPGL